MGGARRCAPRTQPKGHAAAPAPRVRRAQARTRAQSREPPRLLPAAAQARLRDAGRQRHPAEEMRATRDVAAAVTSTSVVGAPSTDARAGGRPSGNAILHRLHHPHRASNPFYFDNKSRQRRRMLDCASPLGTPRCLFSTQTTTRCPLRLCRYEVMRWSNIKVITSVLL